MNNLCSPMLGTNATVRSGMAYPYRLGILLFVFTLGLTWIPVQAAFPATANPTHEYRLDSASYGIHVIGSTPQDACTQFKDIYTSRNTAAGNGFSMLFTSYTPGGTSGTCLFTIYRYGNFYGQESQTPVAYGIVPTPPPYTCPEKSALSGSSCTCEVGYQEVGSACVVPPPPEPEEAEKSRGLESSAATSASLVCRAPSRQRADGERVGNPIIPATGEKMLDHSDYAGNGPDALDLVRSFRSSRVIGANAIAATAGLGQTWSHTHLVSLVKNGPAATAGSTAQVMFGDGRRRLFAWSTTSNSWVSASGPSTLTPSAGGLLYKRIEDDTAWQFDTAGKLLTMTHRNGWVRTYTYSTINTPASIAPVTGLLLSVKNHFGRILNFKYNAAGQLASVTASDGQVISYGYDGTAATARLTTVSYPGNVSSTVNRIYHYDNTTFTQLLTGITDELGNRYETLSYDSLGRGTSTQLAGGADLYTVSYGSGSATVTDPLGTQRTYNYGTTQSKLAVLGADKPSGTGNSSTASRVQDANGFITQETDFLGVNTMYTWDINRRLPLATTKAAGLPEAQTSSTQWHAVYRLPTLVTEAGRTTAYTYDGAGNRLSQTVTDTANTVSRTANWTYNANGQALTAKGPRADVNDADSFAYYSNTSFTDQPPGTDPFFDSVSLLLHGDGMDGAVAVTDSSGSAKPVTVAGNTVISTAQSKFGGASLRVDGVRDYVSVPAGSSLALQAADFTIEMWIHKLGNNPNYGRLWDPDGDFYTDVNLQIDPNGNLVTYGSSTGTSWNAWAFTTGIAILNSVWKHVALVRAGGTLTLYVDGVGTVVTTALGTTALHDAGQPHAVGGQGMHVDRSFNGYIDEVRVTKGVARYTANFTPPMQAFPNMGPTINPNAVGHAAGDLQSITNAAGHVTQFTLYDRAGRMRQMIDPKGVVTDTTYTQRGWISSVTVTPPGGAARTTNYTYDNAGQLTGVVMPDTTTMSYSYDAAHRWTGVMDAKGNSVTYTLDDMGNKTAEQVKDPSGNLQRNITRVYDALNRIQQVTGASN